MENKPIDRQIMREYATALIYYRYNPDKASLHRSALKDIYSSLQELKEPLAKDNPDYIELQGFEKKARQLLMKDLVNKIKKGELEKYLAEKLKKGELN